MFTKVNKTKFYDDMMPIEDVKRSLGIYDDQDDVELEMMRDSAFSMAESYCYRQFSASHVTLSRDDGEKAFWLPYNDNVEITHVLVDGVETNNFKFNYVTGRFYILDDYKELFIFYNCGVEKLPIAIDRGIKFLISTIYNSGQDFVSGMEVTKLPLRCTHFFDTEKHYVI